MPESHSYDISDYINRQRAHAPAEPAFPPAERSTRGATRELPMAPPPLLEANQLWANIQQLQAIAGDPTNLELIFDENRPKDATSAKRLLTIGFRRLVDIKHLAAKDSKSLTTADQRAVSAFRSYGLMVSGYSQEEQKDTRLESRGLEVISFLALENDVEARNDLALRRYQGGLALIGTVKLFKHQSLSAPPT